MKLAELLFFPSFCELCQRLLENAGESVICHDCQGKVQACGDPFCPVCGRFYESTGAPHLCAECLEKRPPLARHRSLGRYEGHLKDIILLFKYRGFEVLGHFLGDLLAGNLAATDLWDGVDAVLPVPLHPRKKRQRGFNQAEVLARRLVEHRKLRLLDKHLIKVRHVPPQTGLEVQERKRNVRGAFQVRREHELAGKTILLVDDVYTTGSTLRECSLVLLRAGAKEVRALTVAQA